MDTQTNGINVGHLLQMQTDLIKAIHDSEQRTGGRIDKLTAQQVIANGRTTKLELSMRSLRQRVDVRLRDGGSIVSELTKTQKAKLAGFGLLIAGAVAEGVHRIIPILIALLSGKVGQP